MIGLIQRVSSARVDVANACVGTIEQGLLVLLGVEAQDTAESAKWLAERIANYRVFSDDAGKMNLSARDLDCAILAVPQFTLAADTSRGRRPSFSRAAPPELGESLFERFTGDLRALEMTVETGVFGADMQVSLVNEGPVTFWLQTPGTQ
ncbi:MAG: D-aminoacyl-tRNA deacylase [Pseudomonadota bacterium]